MFQFHSPDQKHFGYLHALDVRAELPHSEASQPAKGSAGNSTARERRSDNTGHQEICPIKTTPFQAAVEEMFLQGVTDCCASKRNMPASALK